MSKESRAAYMRVWYQKNKEKVKGWTKRWAEANPEKVRNNGRLLQSRYQATHPERVRATRHKRLDGIRELKRAAKAGGCADCGETNEKTLILHHVDPSTKLFTLGSGAATLYGYFGPQMVRDEIAKCVCLCRPCHRKRHGLKPSKKRDAVRHLLDEAKRAGCRRCGSRANLEFHHRDPTTKLFPVSRALGLGGLQKARDEIAKCDCICKTCHRLEHTTTAERIAV